MTTDIIHSFYVKHKLIVERAGFIGNQLSITILIGVAPQVLNSSQCHHQCTGANHNNAAIIGVTHHVWIMVKGHHKRGFHWYKDQHKVETINPF